MTAGLKVPGTLAWRLSVARLPVRVAAMLAAFLAPAVFVSPAAAQQLPQQLPMSTGTIVGRPTILTLNQERLYTQSEFGQALEKKSNDALKKLAAQNRKIEAQLIAEEKALTEKRKKMTAAAFQPLAEAFNTRVEKIRAAQDAKSKAIQQDRAAGRKKFFETALPILAELMRERGALAILDKNSVILSFDSIDITNAAIAALNTRLGDGSSLPATPTTPGSASSPGTSPGTTSSGTAQTPAKPSLKLTTPSPSPAGPSGTTLPQP